MAKKNSTPATEKLRTANFEEFKANHGFTKESKKADFQRAGIKAGLTVAEIVEIGNEIYGEGEIKAHCVNWYKSSDPQVTGKPRAKSGAKVAEIRAIIATYYNEGSDEVKAQFEKDLIAAVSMEELLKTTKIDVLKSIVPEDILPKKPVKEKKAPMTEVEKLLKKQEAAEKKAAELRAKLEAAKAAEAAATEPEAVKA